MRFSACSRNCYVRITVCYERDVSCCLKQAIRVFLSEILQVSDGGVFLENHFAVSIREYLKGIPFTYPECSTDFFRYDYTAQVIDAAYYSCCFHMPDTS